MTLSLHDIAILIGESKYLWPKVKTDWPGIESTLSCPGCRAKAIPDNKTVLARNENF